MPNIPVCMSSFSFSDLLIKQRAPIPERERSIANRLLGFSVWKPKSPTLSAWLRHFLHENYLLDRDRMRTS